MQQVGRRAESSGMRRLWLQGGRFKPDTGRERRQAGWYLTLGVPAAQDEIKVITNKILQVESSVGVVTTLINNAAVMPCKSFFNYSPQELEKMYNINVFGNYWT